MKYHVHLSKDEEKLLQDYFKRSPIKLMRHKVQVISMRSNGFTVEQISMALFKQERTIRRWIKEFCEIRMASIFSGQVGNDNASKLTKLKKLLKTLLLSLAYRQKMAYFSKRRSQ